MKKASLGNTRPGVIRGTQKTVVAVRIVSLLVESALGVAIIMIIALLYSSWARASKLRQDPGSLNNAMILVDQKISMIEGDATETYSVQASIDNETISLRRTHSIRQLPEDVPGPAKQPFQMPADDKSSFEPLGPVEMRLTAGAVFLVILILAVFALIYVQQKIGRDFGLSLPSGNPVVIKIITNYVPVVFATILGPVWLLLNRMLCVPQPFEKLQSLGAKPSQTINLHYSSLPPQLVVWRALRARHLVLAAVCAIGLSANVLSVALSGLFQIKVVSVSRPTVHQTRFLPVMNPVSDTLADTDHCYTTKSNFSDHAALPPWVSQHMFLVPFEVNPGSTDDGPTTYQGRTQGIIVQIDSAPIQYNSTAFILGEQATAEIPHRFSGERNFTCNPFNSGPHGGQKSKSAMEVLKWLTATNINDTVAATICGTLLLAGFLRANLYVESENVKPENSDQSDETKINSINSLASTWMICRPTLLVAPHEVIVDRSGRIQNATQIEPHTAEVDQFLAEGFQIASFLHQLNRCLFNADDVEGYW